MEAIKALFEQVEQERREKIETAVERMLQDGTMGVLIIENQFGVIKSAELSPSIPYGSIILKREDVTLNGIV